MAEKKCNNCGTNNAPASVPFSVYESVMAQIRRLVLVIVLLIVLLVGTNAGWLICEAQFEVVEESVKLQLYSLSPSS